MNIIKFKDTFITDTSKVDFEWYNETLRGKYAYWIRCRYVVPLEAISQNMYVSFETTINNLIGETYYVLTQANNGYVYVVVSGNDLSENQKENAEVVTVVPSSPTSESAALIKTVRNVTHYIDLWDGDGSWVNSYIDVVETDRINDVSWLIKTNSYVPEGDITVEELKVFRTWLATNLLEISEWSDDDTHVLSYYAEGMSDEITKWLTIFGDSPISINKVGVSNCGCIGSGNLSSLYNESISMCDTLQIYRNNIKTSMVQLFSNVDMWSKLPGSFLNEIVRYLTGIITSNLPFEELNVFDSYKCGCTSGTDSAQVQAHGMLHDLIASFEWIIKNEVTGHKIFIQNSLFKWADNLYEKMEWS